MQTGLIFFEKLTREDIEWTFNNGSELDLSPETMLLAENEPVENFYVILQGILRVVVGKKTVENLGTLGPGDVIGEISLLNNGNAPATIKASEQAKVLVLPHSVLEQKIAEDDAFSGRFYRALARILSYQLRDTNRRMGQIKRMRGERPAESSPRRLLAEAIRKLKSQFQAVAEQSTESDAPLPEGSITALRRQISHFILLLNRYLGPKEPENQVIKDELGRWMHREMLPFLLMTENGGRWYSKPRGYAGDYLTIGGIYDNLASGIGKLGPLLDHCFLDISAARAIRNRRQFLAEEILKTALSRKGDIVRVTGLGCAPAHEVFDSYEAYPEECLNMQTTLIDIDQLAVDFVEEKAAADGVDDRITVINSNLVYLISGNNEVDLMPQDLIYCSGLADYLTDNYVVMLLNYIHKHLRPGGKVIISNMHTSNSCKAFMDYVLDWHLIHRNEDELGRLFLASNFGQRCENIRFEAEHINMFASCIKT